MRVFPCKIKRKLIKATPVPEGHGRAELNFAYMPKILFDVIAKTNISQCLNNFCSFSYQGVHVKKLETLNFPSSQFFEVYNEILFPKFLNFFLDNSIQIYGNMIHNTDYRNCKLRIGSKSIWLISRR